MTPTVITDAADPRLDDFRALNDQPFRRRYEGDECFIAEGYVAIDRLIESGHRIRSVLLAPSRVERFTSRAAVIEPLGASVYVAERDVIADTVGFDLHRGVIACADRRSPPALTDLTSTARRIAVLDGLNDAENVGAIARAARALGIDGMILDPTCTDHYSRRSVRVSMGEVLLLPIVRSGPTPDTAARLRADGFEVWAMTPSPDAADLWDVSVPERVAVVLGAEGPGLDSATMAAADRCVRIPIAAEVDSLNVGHAAAITFAAIARPR